MTKIKCPKCGEVDFIFKTPRDRFTCPICGEFVTAEFVPEFVEDYKKRKAELRNKFISIVKEYEETDDAKNIHTEAHNINRYEEEPYFEELWREFILNAVGIAVEKKDKELQTFLKNHAKDFDKKYVSDSGLFASVLKSYHNIGTNNDWEELINQAGGDDAKFTALSEIIIDYIVKNKDKAFAMDIFAMLLKRADDEAWVDEGRIYIRALFSNDEVAEKVFPRSAFNGRTKKFFKDVNAYCKKYHNISVEETKVWGNYLAACRVQKRRNIIILSCTLAVVASVCIGVFFYMNAIKKSTVSFDIDRVIETTYGEELDLSEYSVSYKKNSGKECKENITANMLSGFNPELVDEQQTVQVKFSGVTQMITIRINPATLAKPVLSQSGSSVSWEFVPNAKDYNVYVNSTAASTCVTTSLSYDLSDNENYGVLNVTVRANSGSDKYKNSEMSEILHITKLQPPANIVYEDGKLKWDEVDGATDYDLSINGTPYTCKTNYFEIGFKQGDNDVEIHAKSTDPKVIEGITVKTVYYLKLDGITEMTFSNNVVRWKSDGNSNYYSVYVDGEYWKDFTREYFNADTDGFFEEFGEARHEIGIVCKSSKAGTVPSAMVSYNVAFGNRVRIEDGMLKWDDVGTGATYMVVVNGSADSIKLSTPHISIAEVQWSDGSNTLSITAALNNATILCDTATVIKHGKPEVSINGNGLQVSGSNNVFSVNGGEWQSEVPDIAAFAVGSHTVKIKTVASSEYALELPSEEVEVTISKLSAPVISVKYGEVVCSYDSSKYALKIFSSDSEGGTFRQLNDISEIRTAGEYYIKASLSALSGAEQDVDFVIDSDYSDAVKVVKLEAPTIAYTNGEEYITVESGGNVKFYYEDKETGKEVELAGGRITGLPKGIFVVYARNVSGADNELSSERSNGVSVFNMNISLAVNQSGGSKTQAYLRFGGCEEIDSITYELELRYYDSNGNLVGTRNDLETTINKNINTSNESIGTTITYLNPNTIIFESGYSQSDLSNVKRVEFIVTIKDGSEGQKLTATLNR